MTQTAKFPQILLKATKLTCERGGRTVFADLDIDLSGGQALFLMGPNGVGKSSLLLALADLIHSTGTINWSANGTPIGESAHQIHFSGHRHAIKPDLSLAENLSFWADMHGGDKALVDPALTSAGLSGLGPFAARNLSAGQTHRLALCRLLIAPRLIWLLDEPSSALDADGDKWVASLIDAQLERGGLVIAATHRTIPLTSQAVKILNMGSVMGRDK